MKTTREDSKTFLLGFPALRQGGRWNSGVFMVLISFIGPPGSGKTTQANMLQVCGFKSINTGELLRSAVRSGTEISAEVDACLKKGHFVPPEITARCVSEELIRSESGYRAFSLDGSPRTIQEFTILYGRFLFSAIIRLNLPDEVSIKRLLARRRFDDQEHVIRERLRLFRINTLELLTYIDNTCPSIPPIIIDATEPAQVIHSKLVLRLGELELIHTQPSSGQVSAIP